ncbi:alanine racemase [Puniceicoccales bacterium CK1056]|uniref:Alanine racemase n=1 Tax=Oceanipulchritudo coccoides TaxID=2706888 RepID=A0A6B2M2I1_9BACT|nr:alanine racemase [Oceanipulchritudo coccoides]NDV62532.1 alanine racemase [Oceanipulchritudo coccoides]
MSRTPDKLRAWATIDLGALERNLKTIRQAMPDYLSYISVVKANAYGHGLAPVVSRLMRANADAFAVANLEEASALREVGVGWPILILSVLLPSEYPEAVRLDVRPVLSSVREVEELGRAAEAQGKCVGVHLKIDTGMGRLGIWFPRFPELLSAIVTHPLLRLEGLCTHFSSADKDPEFTTIQRTRFLECLAKVPAGETENLLIHADNSAGIESFPEDGPFNAARVGLLQFGIRPAPQSLLGKAITEPVLSFHARVGLVKELPKGTPVSYGQMYRLQRDSRIAVLTAGYADGLSTALSNTGQVIIGDCLCPIIGRVTMDQTMVDVTDMPASPAVGNKATFIGSSPSHSISVSQYAGWSNQIEWESLCSLSARTQRIYQTDSAL